MLTNFHGRSFNGPYAVIAHSDRSLWFTDPGPGAGAGGNGNRNAGRGAGLPQHVYRFEPGTGDCRVVADGFDGLGALCFAPDERTLYVCDMGAVRSGGTTNAARSATVYAYSVVCPYRNLNPKLTNNNNTNNNNNNEGQPAAAAAAAAAASPFLTNRRVFAYVATGVPRGIRCDGFGNVWAGCGDGVNVWDRGGRLLGKVLVAGGGVSGLCWGEGGEMWIAGGERLWRVEVGEGVRGV